jgi:hypothetical protein
MIIAYDSQLEEPMRNQNNCDEEEQRRRLKEEDWQIATPAEKRIWPTKGRKAGRQARKQERPNYLQKKARKSKKTKQNPPRKAKQTERPRERRRTELAKLLCNRWM